MPMHAWIASKNIFQKHNLFVTRTSAGEQREGAECRRSEGRNDIGPGHTWDTQQPDKNIQWLM